MPLRAVGDQGNVHSFEFDAASWAELKGTYKTLNLRIPCCNVPAIPKSSTLGNFFFAHARRGECTTAPESAEHLYCKNLVAKAAIAAGWTVTTEMPGASPSGEEWIADVMCERGTARIALEVQMSPQTLDETIRRQTRYKASGVRSAWLLGPKVKNVSFTSNKDLPAFSLSPVSVGVEPTVERFKVQLSEFVQGMLNKQLRWSEPDIPQPLYVEYLDDTCWSCHAPVKQVYGLLRTLDEDDYGPDRHFSVAAVSTSLLGVLAEVDNSELDAAGLNTIVERTVIKGKPTRWGFINLCTHCQAPQDSFHLGEKLRKALYGVYTDPQYPGSEVHEEPEFNPPVGTVKIERWTKGQGRWEYVEKDIGSSKEKPVSPLE